jgi:hypothetical protein
VRAASPLTFPRAVKRRSTIRPWPGLSTAKTVHRVPSIGFMMKIGDTVASSGKAYGAADRFPTSGSAGKATVPVCIVVVDANCEVMFAKIADGTPGSFHAALMYESQVCLFGALGRPYHSGGSPHLKQAPRKSRMDSHRTSRQRSRRARATCMLRGLHFIKKENPNV